MSDDYVEFLRAKTPRVQESGFAPPFPVLASLFDWQARVTTVALRRGRCALFESCGLGKTIQQLEWARQTVAHTGRYVLILTPLAVAAQTVREGARFGINAKQVRDPDDMFGAGIYVTNYERLELFADVIPTLGGVVLDESSILKSFDGKTRRKLTDAFAATPYKLCCTATPSPNDFTELGQHAEFLGICTPAQMLATYFINDTFDTGTWRLKKHAVSDFWAWVASWAICVAKPSDAGGDDAAFELPPLEIREVRVETEAATAPEGELFAVSSALSATQMRTEKRKSIAERARMAAEIAMATDEPVIIWCDLNDEAEALIDALPADQMVEVRGSDRPEWKERKLDLFATGERRIIVTKPSIAGFGLNWQHCNTIVFIGVTYSFESFYQAVRRSYRFGQKRPVTVHALTTDADHSVFRVLNRKIRQHETMQEAMRAASVDSLMNNRQPSMNTAIESASSERWTAYHGDCVRVARSLETDSIGLSIFSPPFADLFTYSDDIQDMGNCADLEAFMRQFEFLVAELMRVTVPGRECAVHCCDLLSAKWKEGAIELKDFSGLIVSAFRSIGWLFHSRITIWKSPVTEMQRTKAHGLLYKTLKKDSANSRVGAPDYLLVFRKPGTNPKPIHHTPEDLPLPLWQELASPVWMTVDQGNVLNGSGAKEQGDERHICPLQLDVIDRAVTLWSAPDDVVFSPFMGIGSEGYGAVKRKRRFIGAELKESYWRQALGNLALAETESASLFDLAAVTKEETAA